MWKLNIEIFKGITLKEGLTFSPYNSFKDIEHLNELNAKVKIFFL